MERHIEIGRVRFGASDEYALLSNDTYFKTSQPVNSAQPIHWKSQKLSDLPRTASHPSVSNRRFEYVLLRPVSILGTDDKKLLFAPKNATAEFDQTSILYLFHTAHHNEVGQLLGIKEIQNGYVDGHLIHRAIVYPVNELDHRRIYTPENALLISNGLGGPIHHRREASFVPAKKMGEPNLFYDPSTFYKAPNWCTGTLVMFAIGKGVYAMVDALRDRSVRFKFFKRDDSVTIPEGTPVVQVLNS